MNFNDYDDRLKNLSKTKILVDGRILSKICKFVVSPSRRGICTSLAPCLLLSMTLVACAERGDGHSQRAEKLSTSDQSPSQIVCDDDMTSDSRDCKDEAYWSEERRRKAKAMPFPTIETPPDGGARDLGEGGVADPSSTGEVPPTVGKTVCDEGTDASREDCTRRSQDYWTEERRRGAKALEPTAPKPPLPAESDVPSPEKARSTEGAGQAPRQLFPKPEDDQG